MNERRVQIYMLAGLWLSFLSLVMGVSTLLPDASSKEENKTAIVYKFASREQSLASTSAGRAVIADLNMMQLTLYEDGVSVQTFPILSKGREGTPWETPAGKYAIQRKEIKHYSSIGGTWMPYSMQFYGNFFIHGWPTYPDGRDVPMGYSGGCIRLATDDAEQVYEFVSRGTKLLVLGSRSQEDFATTSRYYLRGEGTPPGITAPSFAVADLDADIALWVREPDTERHPGGLVALMTALTAVETVNQYKIIRMSELLMGKYILRKYSIGALDELPIGSLIYPLLFDSNDTAGRVFAQEHGLSQFVKYMNEKSVAVGLKQTTFSGVLSTDPATTTARDLFTLLGYVDRNKHFLIDVTLSEERTLMDDAGDERYQWINKNPWIRSGDGTFRGGLVAGDGGGDALVLFALPLSEFGSRTIAFVLLDSTDTIGDINRLRDFILTHFTYGIEPTTLESATSTPLRYEKGFVDFQKLFQDELEYEREV